MVVAHRIAPWCITTVTRLPATSFAIVQPAAFVPVFFFYDGKIPCNSLLQRLTLYICWFILASISWHCTNVIKATDTRLFAYFPVLRYRPRFQLDKNLPAKAQWLWSVLSARVHCWPLCRITRWLLFSLRRLNAISKCRCFNLLCVPPYSTLLVPCRCCPVCCLPVLQRQWLLFQFPLLYHRLHGQPTPRPATA